MTKRSAPLCQTPSPRRTKQRTERSSKYTSFCVPRLVDLFLTHRVLHRR